MSDLVRGSVAPGFERVRELFEENFARRREVGAACAAWRGDELLVDLQGGFRDRARTLPWERDTLALAFSTTKGVVSLALALAHSRGLLDPDARVTELWPEFGAHGKERVTVRELLGHRAGLLTPPERIHPGLLADPDRAAAVYARAAPLWEPGACHGYHALTYGAYAGELLRRVDPHGRTAGNFVREELAAPLGEEFHIGLPESADDRAAEVVPFRLYELRPGALPLGLLLRILVPGSLPRRAMANPRFWSPAALGRPEWRRVEFASGNGYGTARALARFYAAFAAPGGPLSVDRATTDALTDYPDPPRLGPVDRVARAETAYSLGFLRPTRDFSFGTSEQAFGMAGAGGGFAFADPNTGVGFAYTPNRMGVHLFDDPREKPLRDAVLACARGPRVC